MTTTKQGIVEALRAQISALEDLVSTIEKSDSPDLREISELPQLLVQKRQALGILPLEISELCGISPTTYRALEKPGGNPRLDTLVRVGDVMNFKLWIEMK